MIVTIPISFEEVAAIELWAVARDAFGCAGQRWGDLPEGIREEFRRYVRVVSDILATKES